MSFDPRSSKSKRRWHGLARLLIVIAGIVTTQFILYGSSLMGRTLLLPLDMLSDLSGTSAAQHIVPHDRQQHDPVNQNEPMRRFAVTEVRAGRLPLWDPHNFSGAPFLAANQTAVFSPFRLLDYLWPDPRALAWGQMLRALVGGIGAYCFFRFALHTRFWAATIGAWIWPMSGFLALWTMWPQSATALWLPWVLLAVHRCARKPDGRSIALLAIPTAFTLISGHSGIGAHVLLGAGIYALWLLFRRKSKRIHVCLALALGWLLGIGVAAPQILPTLQYLQNSMRIGARMSQGSETKPVGFSALPQIVLPWLHGTTRSGWIYLGSDIPLESAICGYVGLLTVMVLAPFGFGDRRRRVDQVFWLALAIVGAAYILDLPGGVAFHRLPVLDSLRGNRFVLVSGFALLTMGVVGLDTLLRAGVHRSKWLLIAPVLTILLAIWCAWRSSEMPNIVSRAAAPAVESAREGGQMLQYAMLQTIDQLTDKFRSLELTYAGYCIVGALLFVALWRWPKRILAMSVGVAACAEVLISVSRINPQSDPALYDWKLPVFEQIARAEPGRICGVGCLPPALNKWAGLDDIRGYDGADPLRYTQFLLLLASPQSPPPDSIAHTFNYIPKFPSPLADFLNLRYLIYRGRPSDPSAARFITPGFYVMENHSALPRATVPRHATIIADESARLAALSDPHFDPRETVIVETDPGIAIKSDVIGDAHIVNELPSRVEIDYTMQTPGLVVLADEWDAGWHASVNGTESPVLLANHAFRAVAVPQGSGKLIFTYDPLSFRIGLWIAAASLVGCIVMAFFPGDSRRTIQPTSGDTPVPRDA